jgi:hypothetical protein
VVVGAHFCKECGAPLRLPPAPAEEPLYRAFVAFGLSVIPGLGHLYRGRLARAILWFFGVAVAYALAYPLGVMIHFIAALNAAFLGIIAPESAASRRRGAARDSTAVARGGPGA